jgi:hypothetical protein
MRKKETKINMIDIRIQTNDGREVQDLIFRKPHIKELVKENPFLQRMENGGESEHYLRKIEAEEDHLRSEELLNQEPDPE